MILNIDSQGITGYASPQNKAPTFIRGIMETL